MNQVLVFPHALTEKSFTFEDHKIHKQPPAVMSEWVDINRKWGKLHFMIWWYFITHVHEKKVVLLGCRSAHWQLWPSPVLSDWGEQSSTIVVHREPHTHSLTTTLSSCLSFTDTYSGIAAQCVSNSLMIITVVSIDSSPPPPTEMSIFLLEFPHKRPDFSWSRQREVFHTGAQQIKLAGKQIFRDTVDSLMTFTPSWSRTPSQRHRFYQDNE